MFNEKGYWLMQVDCIDRKRRDDEGWRLKR